MPPLRCESTKKFYSLAGVCKNSCFWNTAARLRLNNHNPTWIRVLARDMPEANWKHKHCQCSTSAMIQFSMPTTQKSKLVSSQKKVLLNTDTYIFSTTIKNDSSLHNLAHTKSRRCLIGRSEHVRKCASF